VIRVLLVSDHPAIRAGLAQVISSEPGLRTDIAAPGGDPQSTLAASWADVVLLDSPLAQHDAFEVCHLLKQLAVPRRVALYSDHSGEEVRLAAWVAGADALIEKSAPAPVLFEQLRLVARGGRVLPSPSARTLTTAARELDAAERIVFGMCVYGVTLEEISRTLRRDPLEVEATVRELIRRLSGQPPHVSPSPPAPAELPPSTARRSRKSSRVISPRA
jgi:DNA-binding NarL/FixJ family response regulator